MRRAHPAFACGLALVVLLLVAPHSPAGEAEWRDPVEPADRPLLDRLLSDDEAVRKAAVARWEEARLAAPQPSGRRRRPPSTAGGLSDRVDPLDTWGLRKKRMLTALVMALQQGEVAQRVAAARSLRDLAPLYTSVIDVLAATLTDAPAPVRLEAIRTLGGIAHLVGGRYVDTKLPDVVARIEDENAAVRAAALQLVGLRIRYGHANDGLRRRALALALDAAADDEASVRSASVSAAASLAAPTDPTLGPLLRKGLDDASSDVRRVAAEKLADRPDDAQQALGRLRALLQDDDFDVRYAAASAVWSATRNAKGLMPILVEALERFEGAELASVARLLTVIGPPAEAATPGLVHALGRVESMRHLANGREIHEALVSIGPSAEIALPAIEEELHRRGAADRRVVLDAVVTVFGEPERLADFVARMLSLYPCPDPAAVEATVLHGLGIETPYLLELAKKRFASDDVWERRNACHYLGRMRSPGAVRLLLDKLQDPTQQVSAIIALMDVGEHARAAIPALVRALPTDPQLAATALVRIAGPQDPEVVEALLGVLEQTPADDHSTVVALCDAVCVYGGEPEPCIDRLLAAFGDRNPMTHRDAAAALGRWGPQAEKALPALRKLMADGEPAYEGITAATAVWQISGEAKPTLEMAVRVLKSSRPMPWLAVHALHLLGPEAASAMPLLIEAARSWRHAFHRQEDVMKEAVVALGAIGPQAADALSVLREFQHNHLVREEARRAIERIEER